MIPNRASPSYFDQIISMKPDLYGPFWISTTLVHIVINYSSTLETLGRLNVQINFQIFTIAISGNLANYLQHANVAYHWKYDFHLVSYAATAIFCYTCIVPLCLWGALKWTASESSIEMADEVSVYYTEKVRFV